MQTSLERHNMLSVIEDGYSGLYDLKELWSILQITIIVIKIYRTSIQIAEE